MSDTATTTTGVDLAVLRQVEDRAIWLSSAIVDHANRVRPNASGLKVGGHQASSASMATIMTALWMTELRAEDRVSVKPHASPMLHALEFLLGQLGPEYLTTLRQFGGLQSYPSRLKDPVPADYSTGSVGIGATAPIWGALARRYVEGHFGSGGRGRQWSLVGDAELDEGAVWEAALDPMVAELGEIVWVVDLNRQSLDRVVPTMGADRMAGMFAAAGWQVLTVKYGHVLGELKSSAIPTGSLALATSEPLVPITAAEPAPDSFIVLPLTQVGSVRPARRGSPIEAYLRIVNPDWHLRVRVVVQRVVVGVDVSRIGNLGWNLAGGLTATPDGDNQPTHKRRPTLRGPEPDPLCRTP